MPAATSIQALYAERFPEFWRRHGGRPYAASSLHVLSARDVDEIRSAAADGVAVYGELQPVLQALDDDTLDALGIPANARAVVRLQRSWNHGSTVGRFDLLHDGARWRIIEYNAETPFLAYEAFSVGAAAVATSPELADPNAGTRTQLGRALRAAFDDIDGRIAVIATNVHREEWFSAHFYADALRDERGGDVDVIPLHTLRAGRDGISDADGRIAGIYRLYPLELLARDAGADRFFDAVGSERVRLVNAPSSLLQQSKMTQVLIWNLAAAGAHFSAAARERVQRTFLPTFADPPDGAGWVSKPILGREGAAVRIDGVASRPEGKQYVAQPRVYQQVVDMQPVCFLDSDGTPQSGYPVVSCFVVGGEPSAIALRVGGRITAGDAHFVPVAVRA